jgi:hypothetical protein
MRMCVIALFFLSTPAWAQWTLVGDSDLSDVYADLTTIRKQGNIIKMWSLYDLKNARRFGGIPYLSSKDQDEYDCDGERTRFLAFSVHSGNMGGGSTIYSDAEPGKWTPLPTGSVVEALWRIACDR